MFVKKIWQNYERLINAPKHPGKTIASIFAQAAGKNYDGGRVMFVAVAAGGELADGAWEEPWRPPPHHGAGPPPPPPGPMDMVAAPPQPPPWKPGAPCLDNPQPS